jgi:1-acyl-sn-glycerol-3-phosphate acyltransferase
LSRSSVEPGQAVDSTAVPGGVAAEHRVNAYIFKIVPEFTMRFMIWLLSHSMYRVEHRNLELIPDEGAALLVCNHVSFVDALLIGGAVRRPIRFVMYTNLQPAGAEFHLSHGGTIPIAGRKEDIQIYERPSRALRSI